MTKNNSPARYWVLLGVIKRSAAIDLALNLAPNRVTGGRTDGRLVIRPSTPPQQPTANSQQPKVTVTVTLYHTPVTRVTALLGSFTDSYILVGNKQFTLTHSTIDTHLGCFAA